MMYKGLFTVIVLSLMVGFVSQSEGAAGKDDGRPNVVLLMTDQQYYGVLGSSGNGIVKTPHLDRMANEGARFTQALCATPFCSPTRASLITGQWPHTHGVVHNVNIPNPNKPEKKKGRSPKYGLPGIEDKHTTLDNMLFDRGYKLRHLGKWHLGKITDLRCYRNQADTFGQRGSYGRWLRQQGESVMDRKARPGEVLDKTFKRVFMTEGIAKVHEIWKDEPKRSPQDLSIVGRSAVAPRGQFESWLTGEAIKWLEQNADKPFMLTLSVSPPHALWVAPDPYYSMYDPAKMFIPQSFNDRPEAYKNYQASRMGALLGESNLREYLRCYYGQVTMMDAQFGRLLAKLRELGLDNNTLVIFTSD
ncbi:MAG: sulfatase-like hydrolase/transferase, partial [Planctomycetota bacterium]